MINLYVFPFHKERLCSLAGSLWHHETRTGYFGYIWSCWIWKKGCWDFLGGKYWNLLVLNSFNLKGKDDNWICSTWWFVLLVCDCISDFSLLKFLWVSRLLFWFWKFINIMFTWRKRNKTQNLMVMIKRNSTVEVGLMFCSHFFH